MYGGSWSYTQGCTCDHENEGKTKILSVCCTEWMLYLVYAVLVVCCSRCPLMIMSWRDREGWLNFVLLWWWSSCSQEREMRNEDANDMEDPSRFEKSGVPHACLSLEGLISALLPHRSAIVPSVSWMRDWLAHKVLSSPSLSWWFGQAPLISISFLSSTLPSP